MGTKSREARGDPGKYAFEDTRLYLSTTILRPRRRTGPRHDAAGVSWSSVYCGDSHRRTTTAVTAEMPIRVACAAPRDVAAAAGTSPLPVMLPSRHGMPFVWSNADTDSVLHGEQPWHATKSHISVLLPNSPSHHSSHVATSWRHSNDVSTSQSGRPASLHSRGVMTTSNSPRLSFQPQSTSAVRGRFTGRKCKATSVSAHVGQSHAA